MTYLTVRPKRDPWTGEIDNWFEDFFRWPARAAETQAGFAPRVNVDETKDEVKLTFEIPGMDKKDIKVTVHDGVLTVSGKRELKQESNEDCCVASRDPHRRVRPLVHSSGNGQRRQDLG